MMEGAIYFRSRYSSSDKCLKTQCLWEEDNQRLIRNPEPSLGFRDRSQFLPDTRRLLIPLKITPRILYGPMCVCACVCACNVGGDRDKKTFGKVTSIGMMAVFSFINLVISELQSSAN